MNLKAIAMAFPADPLSWVIVAFVVGGILGVALGFSIAGRYQPLPKRRRRLDPLDDSYKHPARQIEAVIWKPVRPVTWGSHHHRRIP